MGAGQTGGAGFFPGAGTDGEAVQTTLLGLAIAVILALVAALVGPHFLDWTRFRPVFEAEASRVVGLPVRVDGAIDARLLPTPSLRLRRISAGFADAPARLAAAELDVEFSLGALMRGEWRATEMSLSGVMLTLGLDASGRLDWPAQAGPFNAGGVTIDRLSLTGRLALRDASSGAALTLDDFGFVGDVRPQAGALRGEGGFSARGQRVPFRVSTARTADNSGARLRLMLDPDQGRWSAEADGVLAFASGAPRFDGQLTLAQAAVTRAGHDGAMRPPWRVGARVALDAAAARFEAVEGNIGADEGGARFSGQGELRFGPRPFLQARLTAKPFDAERLIAAFGGAPGAPLQALTGLGDLIGAVPRPFLPARLEIGAESVAWGGRTLQNVMLDARAEAGIWRLEAFEARAPGAARVTLAGRLDPAATPPAFDGTATVEAADPALTWAWLSGRQETAWTTARPLRAAAMLGLGPGKLIWRGLKAEAAGLTLEGDGAFGGAGQRRAVLKASAPSLEPFGALLSPHAPELADLMRALARDGAAHAELVFNAETPRDEATPAATLALRAPSLAVEASIAVPAEALARAELPALAQAPLTLRMKLAADRAAPLMAALGLADAIAASGKAELTLEATATALDALRAPLPLRATLQAGGADLTLAGAADWRTGWGLSLAGELDLRGADVAPLFGRARALPLTLRAHLTRTPEAIALEKIDAALLGTRVRGRLNATRGDVPAIDGDLAADSLAAGPLLALVLGVPEAAADEPLGRGLAGRWRGRVGLAAARAELVEGMEARSLTLTLRADGDAVTLEPIAAEIGGGRLGGRVAVRASAEGVALDAALDASAVEGAALRYHALAMPAGRVDAAMTLAGKGRSLAALIGSLSGAGRITLDRAKFAGLDPVAFAIAEHAAAGGPAPDPARLRDSLDRALSAGALDVAAAEFAVTVRDGRLRVERTMLEGTGAALAVSGGYDLAARLIEARGVLTATKESAEARRPELRLSWRGPAEAPLRTLDVSPLMGWIALQRVEGETRRLDALEREGRAAPETARAVPPEPARDTAAPIAPLPPAVEVRPPPGARKRVPAPLRPPLVLTPN